MTYADLKACAASALTNGYDELAGQLSLLADEQLCRTSRCARCGAVVRTTAGLCALCGSSGCLQ